MGLGAAMVFPATLSLISNVFTERGERARAIGLWGATAGMAIALGPIVGGWLLERLDWRSIFFAMAPVAAVAAAARRALRADLARSGRAADRPRRASCSRAPRSALLIYTIIEAPEPRLGQRADARRLRADRGAARRVRRLGAAHRASRCSTSACSRNPRFTAASGSVDGRVLRAVRVHLPDHPVLPVLQGLRPAVDRRAPAAGRDLASRSPRSSAPSSRCASAPSWSSPPGCS